MERKTRRSYDPEFKRMAVELCATGRTATSVADELGLRRDLVSRWCREHLDNSESSFPGNGQKRMTAEEKELEQLRKELADVKIERDILKKAVSIFSKNDGKSFNS
jgi:transposase